MKSASLALRRRSSSRRWRIYRPVIEVLERRLPPGNLLSSLLLGGSALALEIDDQQLDASVRPFRIKEKPEIISERSSTSFLASYSTDLPVARELKRQAETTSDEIQAGAKPSRITAPGFNHIGRASSQTGFQLSGLTAPSSRGAGPVGARLASVQRSVG